LAKDLQLNLVEQDVLVTYESHFQSLAKDLQSGKVKISPMIVWDSISDGDNVSESAVVEEVEDE
jgi:hypothetical protein